ncbi:MAG: SDR family oxidoreductase [bacterium]|nr:SDR family oxidoreductase [bacterium]
MYCQYLPTKPMPAMGKIIVTGATGYIGGQLVPELLARGYDVRVVVRAMSSEHQERWPGAEIVAADALDIDSLRNVLDGVHTAYYLIHSLLLGARRFETADIMAAQNFRTVAEEKGLHRIIYLGGLGDVRSNLSAHLRSRHEVCRELMSGSTPVTALRAAVIIGAGSASYEMMEHLVKNVVVLFIPSWAKTLCQPIAICNVIMYLVGVLETPSTVGESYDIGGVEVLSYDKMLRILAETLGLRRFFVPMFFSHIGAYAYLASLVTPVPHSIAWCLLEGTANEVTCDNHKIREVLDIRLMTYREALLRAMSREEQDSLRSRWSDAYPPAHALAMKLHEAGGRIQYRKECSLISDKSASALFRSICRVGGDEGWFNTNWLWMVRGMMDQILMGVGITRGRRHQQRLRINDVLDFWRVEDLQQDRRLLLRAEMRLPGRAWLEFTISPEAQNLNTLSVIAHYEAHGFWGKGYWIACVPLHKLVFDDLIQQIERRS